MLGLMARNWWALALRGLFAVIFGLIALWLPGITIEALILLFGAYALADGVFAIIAAVRAAAAHERWGSLIVEGVISVAAGLVAFFVPIAAALGFLYLFAGWAFVTGVIEIAAAVELRRAIEGEWLLILNGALSIVLGVLLAMAPGMGLVVLVWWIGIYAILFGVLLIMLAFRLRAQAPHQAKIVHS